MESSLPTLIKIAQISQELSAALSNVSSRNGIKKQEVSRAQFLLNRIVASSGAILEILNLSMANGIPLNEQLQNWISTNGPVICLLALDKMKKIIGPDPTRSTLGISDAWFSMFFTREPYEGIGEAIKIIDGHHDYFDYLLTSGVWNHKANLLQHAMVARGSARNSQTRGKPDAPRIADVGHSNFSQNFLLLAHAVPPSRNMVNEDKARFIFDFRFDSPDNVCKLERILRWINSSRCIEKHEDTLSQRQSDTCTWLPETADFKAWLAGENSFLWLRGKAGSGKSVLIASVIERLEKTIMDEPLAYFYCDFGNEESMDATRVMRSLLYQLLDQYRHNKLKREALLIVDELEEEKRKGDAALNHITRLSSLVSRVARQFPRPPRIVIDALDECKEIDRLLHALLELKAGEVRLIVSSRPILAIQHKFGGLASISLDAMAGAVSGDIKLHIHREVDSHSRLAFLDPVLKQKIRTTLEQKADGMFRWVQCQLDTLKGCVTLEDLHETLNNLPVGLEATYERILFGIGQQKSEWKVARRALAWLVTASRSLTLAEMIEALTFDFEKRVFNREMAPMHKYALLDVLGSLVVHNEETDIVNLSHSSVKEYLIDECTRIKLPAYHISLHEAHKQVFQQCMWYLTASLNPESLLEGNGTLQSQHVVTVTLIPSRPLLDYVFSCAFDHLAQLEPTDGTAISSMAILQSEIQKRQMTWKHMCALAAMYSQYKSWITPDHAFVVCALISLFPEPFLRAFLSRTSPETEYNSNPLVHAAHFDKADHARTLLIRGVDVDSSGCDIGPGGAKRTVPLLVALRHRNDILVDLFLKEGNAAIPGQVYSTIFSWNRCEYSSRHILSLIQADEFAEWVMDDGVRGAETLFRTLDRHQYFQPHETEEHSLAVIRRLVQIGMRGHDLTSEAFLLTVASAVSSGCVSLLRYLISIGAPIPSRILFSELVNASVEDLARQGIDLEAVGAMGDAALREVLGQCSWSSECWELDCDRCGNSKSTLLTTLGLLQERILARILMRSKSLLSWSTSEAFKTGDYWCYTTRFSDVLQRLRKIRTAAGTLLQSIDRFLSDDMTLGDDEAGWLRGEEPKECLDVLQQMLELSTSDAPTISVEVGIATLFNQRKKTLRFLLKDDDDDVGDPFELDVEHTTMVPIVRRELEGAHLSHSFQCQSDDYGTLLSASSVDEIIGDQKRHEINKMPWTSAEVVFVGQTGAGKSTLINMIMGVPNHSQSAARVGRSSHAVTSHSASYSCALATGLRCQLWDTRGLEDTADGIMVFQHVGVESELRISSVGEKRIVMWCIPASKIDFPASWAQFYDAYEEQSTGLSDALIVIVVTQMDPSVDEWESKCKHHLQQSGLKVGGDGIGDSEVLFLRVRKHRGVSSPEYIEDSKALRDCIAQLAWTTTFSLPLQTHSATSLNVDF